MFTGIISAIGTVRAITAIGAGHDMRLEIGVAPDFLATPPTVVIGASIACSGCCLTAVALGMDFFTLEVSAETLSKTTLGAWRVGSRLNLERPLRMGDELGGHMVSGHVDGLGALVSTTPENGSTRLLFRAPDAIARFLAPKGSVAIDGVSLTVNEVQGNIFGVNIIPHTATATTLGALAPDDAVNLEIDMLARYVARLAEAR
jgi:riboflavin synthase